MSRRIDSLEQQNADLREQLDGHHETEPDSGRFNRRNLLRLGGVAAAVDANNAILGNISNTGSAATAVKGQTSGKGSAIEGVSAHGVAGKFSGPVPLYLVPRSTKGHPSAAAGVFVVDHSGNLWYCKGGSTWKQLA